MQRLKTSKTKNPIFSLRMGHSFRLVFSSSAVLEKTGVDLGTIFIKTEKPESFNWTPMHL